MRTDDKRSYAQNRANKTRRAYLITGLGHVWAAFPENIRLAKESDKKTGMLVFGGIAEIIRPNHPLTAAGSD